MIARHTLRHSPRRLLRTLCVPCLLLLARTVTAQTTSTAAPPADPLLQLSPQAAYDQAMLPVVIVHRSVANWSVSEAASLSVAVAQAQTFCKARSSAPYSNADLLGLARLCALGQQWNAVLDASNRLLSTLPTPLAPQGTILAAPSPRATALSFKIEAALNLQDPATALATGQSLLATEPYSALTQQITDTLIRYLQLVQTGDALNLAGKRLDRILPLLSASGPLTRNEQMAGAGSQTVTMPAPSGADIIPAHELYTAALAAPTLLQLEANAPAAAQTLTTIEAAVPSQLGTDEFTLIQLARRRYQLLDASLPQIPASVSLFSPAETPRINRNFGAATVLLIFPDWCAQCVRVGTEQFMPFLARHAGENIHLYGLLAQLHPPPVAAAPAPRRRGGPTAAAGETASASETQPTAADLLRGTPTLVVASSLPITAFATTDFPLLVIADHDGRIRFADTAPENAFIPGSLVDQLITRVVELWPPPPERHP